MRSSVHRLGDRDEQHVVGGATGSRGTLRATASWTALEIGAYVQSLNPVRLGDSSMRRARASAGGRAATATSRPRRRARGDTRRSRSGRQPVQRPQVVDRGAGRTPRRGELVLVGLPEIEHPLSRARRASPTRSQSPGKAALQPLDHGLVHLVAAGADGGADRDHQIRPARSPPPPESVRRRRGPPTARSRASPRAPRRAAAARGIVEHERQAIGGEDGERQPAARPSRGRRPGPRARPRSARSTSAPWTCLANAGGAREPARSQERRAPRGRRAAATRSASPRRESGAW